MDLEPIKLRPHHGMCIPLFCGHGYSGKFVENLSHIRDCLQENPSRVIQLWNGADCVCAMCPNNRDGICKTAEKVARYDEKCLQICGVEFHEILSWDRFRSIVKQKILLHPSAREGICSDCLWNSLCQQQDVD